MEIDEDKIREWAEAVEDMERKDGFKGDVSTRETIFENEDEGFEWGTTIGTFSVDENTITEMGSIGQFDASHLFTVYIHPDEGMTPHFHVFDKEGKDKKKSTDPGRHTCVEIRQNKYFKHGAYADSLDGKTRKALDRFMRGIRIRPKYSTDIGVTNFIHTINEWDDNNAEEGSANWVDSDNTEQPDYKTIIDNL